MIKVNFVELSENPQIQNDGIEKMIEQQVLKSPSNLHGRLDHWGYMCSLQIAPEQTIDYTLFFHWFEVVSNTGELLIQDSMHNELSLFPHTLFEASN